MRDTRDKLIEIKIDDCRPPTIDKVVDGHQFLILFFHGGWWSMVIVDGWWSSIVVPLSMLLVSSPT